MNLRYPNTESFFLNTDDHKQMHCYWIKSKPELTDEDDEVLADE
jgi:hypothetical protein